MVAMTLAKVCSRDTKTNITGEMLLCLLNLVKLNVLRGESWLYIPIFTHTVIVHLIVSPCKKKKTRHFFVGSL